MMASRATDNGNQCMFARLDSRMPAGNSSIRFQLLLNCQYKLQIQISLINLCMNNQKTKIFEKVPDEQNLLGSADENRFKKYDYYQKTPKSKKNKNTMLIILIVLMLVGLWVVGLTVRALLNSFELDIYPLKELKNTQQDHANSAVDQAPGSSPATPHSQQGSVSLIDSHQKPVSLIPENPPPTPQQQPEITSSSLRDSEKASQRMTLIPSLPQTPISLPQNQDELVEDEETECESYSQKSMKFSNVYSADKYLNINKVRPFPQLPICVLAIQSGGSKAGDIEQSLESQKNAEGFRAVYMLPQKEQRVAKEHVYYYSNLSYFSFRQAIETHCQPNPLILVANSPLLPTALQQLNELHQQYKAWIAISYENKQYQVHSFYKRVFDLIAINGFEEEKQEQLGEEAPGSLGLAFMELSKRFKRLINSSLLFDSMGEFPHLAVPEQLCLELTREPYQQLFSLSQDYPADIEDLKRGWRQFNENKQKHFNGYVATLKAKMTQEKGRMGIEYEQLLYLPEGHSLEKREEMHYEEEYGIGRYEEEMGLCVTVPSLNNMKENRYKRAMESIMKQKYQNYHVVFLDDNSDDGTLQNTRHLLQTAGFPMARVTFVRNLQRRYAIYNIVHAAHRFCRDHEVQMMLDGDDRYIGNLVFAFFNAMYQRNSEVWVAYSTYISTFFTYGESYPVKHRLDNRLKGRKIGHYIGLERSWYVKLVRQIPLHYHQWNNGSWLDVMADDSLQYSLYELAGNDRLAYYPEINYYYSMVYDNNKSKKERKKVRDRAHQEAMRKPRNKLLDSLSHDFPPNQEILDIFIAEEGTKFEVIHP